MSYESLNRTRAAQLGIVTKVTNSINAFNPLTQSTHVLKALKENLTSAQRAHQTAINAMLDHDDADLDQIDDDIDTFRQAHVNAFALLDEKLEALRADIDVDNTVAITGDFEATKYQFNEFEVFIDECDTTCITVSELRMRLKDLSPLLPKYIQLWTQLHARGDNLRKNELKEERKTFTTSFYKAVGWFDNAISSRATTPQFTSTPRSTESVVNLPTFPATTNHLQMPASSYQATPQHLNASASPFSFPSANCNATSTGNQSVTAMVNI
jgi:hypothetical protein